MSSHYKAFLIVIVITLLAFAVTRPVFSQLMGAQSFARRRNAWLALTAGAFLAPSFWLYVPLAAVVIGYVTAKDENPAAVYLLLLLAVPPVTYSISGLGIVNQLFALDHMRLLSLVCLLPAAVKWVNGNRGRARDSGTTAAGKWTAADICILAFAVWQWALLMQYESLTSSMRRAFLLSIDMLLPYYVLSRTCNSPRKVQDCMASFALAAVVLTPLAVFEFFKGWLLYSSVEEQWGSIDLFGYLKREDFLRAQVTSGQSIVLGYSMAIAVGFWLFLQARVTSRTVAWLGGLVLATGLVVTLARGPWLGAALTAFTLLLLGPNAANRALKALLLAAVAGGLLLASPWGDKVVGYLPFIGSVDEGSVTYRQRLAEISWTLIQQNPVLGMPGFMRYMEELRQGQGIIDLVNTYATIALSFGLTGLAFFVGVFATVIAKSVRAVRRLATADPALSLMGASLVGCTVGALLTIGTVSNYLTIPYLYWSLAGLGAAYARFGAMQAPAVRERTPWRAAAPER